MLNDEYLKQLLEKNLQASEESLKILKKINRDRIIGKFFNILKWTIIIGASVGAYYYIQPYLNQLLNTFAELQKMQNSIQPGLQNVPNIQNLDLGNLQNLLKGKAN